MKVLYIFGPPLGIGGHYNSALSYVTYLVRKNVKIDLICDSMSNPAMIEDFRKLGVRVYPVSHKNGSYYVHGLVLVHLGKAQVKLLVDLSYSHVAFDVVGV